ncbi:MAG: hypothetical protein HY063_01300 [Bacteroidetes bacterium]|nr:hypothetical protein [Bacteroidota bacterium]
MNKESEDKLTNAIITLHQEIKGLRGDMDKHQTKTNSELAKLNLSVKELRLSVVHLDDRMSAMEDSFNAMRSDMNGLRSDFNKYAQRNDDRADDHETRITRLENSPSIASEPRAVYKKIKKKK